MVFHKYKLIVIGVPKNASSSMFDALQNQTDYQHTHETIIETFHTQDNDLMELYTSIAVVRNPYDRFFSACHQIRRDSEENQKLTIGEIIEQEILNRNHFNDVFQAQHRYISIGSKVLIDKIFKYETLNEDWKEFAEEFNKTSQFPIPSFLPKSNASSQKQPWEKDMLLLNQDQLDLINHLYAKDFKLFGYEMIKKIPTT